MRAIQPLAIRRECQIAGAPSRRQSLGFLPALNVDDRNVAAEAIGDIECLAIAVDRDSVRLKARNQDSHDFELMDIDYRDGVVPRVGDEKLLSARRQGYAAGDVAHRDYPYDLAGPR